MYNKLLISAGGGIISRSQQSEQAQAATIAIGLGGTGISCLRELKKEVFNKLKPDPSSGDIPSYSHIKFLAVDTDKRSLGDNGAIDTIDSNTEFFDISCPDIIGLLERVSTLKNDPHLTWLSSDDGKSGQGLSILNASAGAGGVRQIGRLLLLQSSREFERRVETLIDSAMKNLPAGSPLNIHIFTGLGGGTGSGTFMDVCYIVQHALKKLGLYGMAQTCGFFFLPDVNIDNVSNPQVKAYIPINGFAAMKELDYAMSYYMNGGEWNQVYDGYSVQSKDAPVKLAHLVTGKMATGATRDNSYAYAMHVVVDYVLEFLTEPYIPENSNDFYTGTFTVESHIANIKKIIGMVPKKFGACYDYCILGASNNYLPYKEITTYLASKIFQGFRYLNSTLPTSNDLDAFLQTSALRLQDIQNELRRHVSSIPNYAVDTQTLYEQCEGLDADTIPQVLVQMRDAWPKVAGELEANKKSLLEEAEAVRGGDAKQISSLISRIKKELNLIAADSSKGPYYAAALLHTVNSKDLQNEIDGYIKTITGELSNANGDLSLRQETMATRLREFQNSGRLSRKKHGEAYVSAVHSYYMQLTKIDYYKSMNAVLTQLKKQVEALYTDYYKKLTGVLSTLSSTFDANLTALAEPIDTNKSYSKPLMTVQELRASLDQVVSEMRIPDIVNHFVSYLIGNDDVWLSQDENKICAIVTKFFLSELDSFTNKTIVDYLKIRFNENDPNRLRKKIYDNIIWPAYNDASPLFWVDASYYSISDASKIGYCSVPEISPEIQGAADDLHKADKNIDKRIVYSTDRISIFEFLCGVPLFGYKGVSNYYPDYDAKKMSGTHLYEKTSLDDRDYWQLPDITPIAAIPVGSRNKVLQMNSDEYDFAKNNGIIYEKADGDYILSVFDSEAVNKILDQIRAVVEQKDIVKADALLATLTDSLPVKEDRILRNDGERGYQEAVVKDHVLASLYMIDLVKEQNDIFRKYQSEKQTLKDMIDQGGSEAKLISDFAEALCAGVIFRDEKNIFLYSYEKVEYGVPESIELTNISTVPYGERLPLYSAFIAYGNLSSEEKAYLVDAVRERKIQNYEQVRTNTETVKQIVQSETQRMINIARQNFKLEANQIVEFVKKLNAELSVL